ncbi:MptD family putative ECF transporter S component [Vagococcus vulneris]|uniref:ABC transporter permease n=1 Tax=Vagococcus vulneris TaxID=1977869 RepID=A0A429ZZN4_9ENTE|nr:MptD family putative ECF transporter S component [Vagococcus vulneris]RST99486.1 ABC transporter permease [Vagococcus vulneris]
MKHLKVHDLISVGIYAAVYFLMVSLATMILRFTVPMFNSILIPSLSALISGIVFLLVLNKIPKFGSITLVGSVMAIFFFMFGYFPLAFLPSIIFPLIADLIIYKTSLGDKVKLYTSYVIFSFGLTGPILPLWFMKEAYVESLIKRGKDQTYIESVFASISTTTFFVSTVLTIICGIIGMLIAQKIYKKHFKKVSM